jgi:hypothetical protein
LVAAAEFKSQIGPSFGNNFNNRTEEAIGTSQDIWTAYREGAFPVTQRPWLGYLMLLEDCERSTCPVTVRQPHFSVFTDFENASYSGRYQIFLSKLMRERLYDSACFMTSTKKDGPIGKCSFPNPDLNFQSFTASLRGHVESHCAKR